MAICHLHSVPQGGLKARLDAEAKAAAGPRRAKAPRSWRQYRPPAARMIAFLRGRVLDKQPNRIIVDVQGVGYDVHVPLSTYYDVGEPGGEVALRVHTHVREDALQLYGFLTDLERQLFERLIGVSGIGPEAGGRVLSGMEARDLVASVHARRRGAADRHSRRRQEDRRAHRPRAEGSARANSASSPKRPRRPRRQPIGCATTCSRRCRTSAIIGPWPRRPSTPRSRRAASPTFELALKAALRELMRSR